VRQSASTAKGALIAIATAKIWSPSSAPKADDGEEDGSERLIGRVERPPA
jgi:hypothetical protein